jgi:triacylglycerol lipase
MFPIILAHGIARFDVLRERVKDELDLPENPLDNELHYFRNVRAHLNSNGFHSVFATSVDFAGSVDLRAEQLKEKTEQVLVETGQEKVHIIAHSMGGLDARRMIVDLGMADRVASLTTIGTPHLGTVLADHVIGNGGSLLIDILRKAIHIDLDGFADLTVSACNQFNSRALESEAKNGVIYQVYSSFERGRDMFIPLVPSWLFIQDHEGRNDGLVSVTSQMWTGQLVAGDGTAKQIRQNEFAIPADHLNEVGWWDLAEAINPIFGGSLHNQKSNYELQIKNIYLQIAQGLQHIG